MFPNLKSTFGFSSNVTPNPFGQSTFGKTSTPGFGQPSTAFGSTSAPLFGQTSQHGSLFSNSTPATFGQTVTTQPTFGGGMFGTNTAQPSSSGLFGSANTSTFGQQNKTTGFGFGTNTASTGFFGQPASTVQPQQQSAGLFGQTSTNLFGSTSGFGTNTSNMQMGTVIKFTPVTGTDTMIKGSINQTISTRHHCITCMKEYENKSLEELRWEDYQVNRKGPQQGTQPTGGLFGNISQPVGGGLFGSVPVATSANTLFGQQDNKSVFGSTGTTAFGQTNTGFGATPATNTSTGGLFGKSLTGFGTNTSTTPTFPFSSSAPQQTTNLFGTSTVNKGFGAQPQQSNLFGQPTGFGAQPSFGSFGQTQNQNVGLFNQNKTTPFNMATSTNNAFGSFSQPTQQQAPSLFSGAKTNTGFGGFGATTTTPAFGQSTFGQTNQTGGLFNSSFNKTPAPLFGQTSSTNTLGGTGLSMTNSNLMFGNTANKQNTMFGGNLGFGSNLGGFGTANNTTNFNLGGQNMQAGVPQVDQSHINTEQQIISMSSTPYGLPSLLNNIHEIDHDIKDSTRPTNPTELNALLNTVNKSNSSPQSEKLQPRQVFGRKVPMFDGLEHRDESLLSNIRMNNNPKRLIIRNKEIKSILEPNSSIQLKANGTSTHSLLDNSDNQRSNKSLLEDNSQEKLYPDLRKETSLNITPGTPKNSKSNNTNLPISSTMINPSAKTLFISNETKDDEDGDGKDEEGDFFAEASDSQDWQDEHNDSPQGGLGGCNDISMYSNGANISGSNSKAHPTGIILTRSEYYTVPSLDELVKYVSEDGTCVVKGFTVGRLGYGNVYFPEAFDVSNLNLDELVHFRHKEINIYPDDSKKPPLGQGLNRKAQVTLDKVWPLDKKAKQIVTDVNSLTKMDYAARLRRLCDKQNTRFVEYRPDTGSWVFKVDHFSKYGHRDSDEEEDAATVAEGKDADPNKKKLPVPIVNKQNDVPILFAGDSVPKPPSTTSMQMSDLAGLRDVVDVAFGAPSMDDDEDLSYMCMDSFDMFQRPKMNDMAKCSLMKSTFFESELADYEDSASDVCSSEGGILELSNYVSRSSPKRKDVLEDDRLSEEPALLMDIFEDEVPEIYPEEPECVQLPIMDEHIEQSDKYYENIADMTAYKGRSFKVGWGRNMTFFCLGTKNTILDYDDSNTDVVTNYFLPISARYITINKITNLNQNMFQDCLEKHLTCQLENSKVEIINEVPYFSSNSGCKLLQNHQKVDKSKSYEQQIWDLCLTLWNEIPDEELNRYDTRTIRKRLFSSWIKSVVDKTVSAELDNNKGNTISNILTCISGNRISEAADLALDSNNLNLSLLISQLPSSMSARIYLRKQLEQWNESEHNKFIDITIWKLYSLVAGNPFTDYGEQNVSVYDGMDWLRILAIYFWYIIEPAESLAHAVNMYERIFSQHVHTARPIPDYGSATEDVYDLRFQLLKFYSDNGYPLTQVLNPSSHTTDILDYRLSWFLLQTLSSLGHADISKQANLFIHMNFAAQLEQMGLWHWAIFVILFIDDSELKKTYIDDILGRHIQLYNVSTPEYRAREKMIVKQFKIPSEWIDAKKADLAILQNNYKEAIYYLCYSNDWIKAYQVIMEYMVPDHFLCYDYDYLIKILTPLSNHKNTLPNWEVAGGLILDFAKLGVQFNNLLAMKETDSIKKHFMDFRAGLMHVSSRLEQFQSPTYIHDVCLAEMSSRIAVMLRKLLNIVNGHSTQICIESALGAQSLPMTSDYLKQELNAILVDFLTVFQPAMVYL